MGIIRQRPPSWYWIVAIILTLWGVMGIAAFYMDVMASPEALAKLPAYDRQLLAARPAWQIWAYGVAVWGGLLGSIALLMKRKQASYFFIASLVGMALSMGPMLFGTDIVAVKGFVGAAAFPIFIVAVGAGQLWFTRFARRRGWLQMR